MRIDLTEKLARTSAGHPWRVIGAWAGATVVAVALIVALLGSALTTDIEQTNNPESERAESLVDEAFPQRVGVDEVIIVRSSSDPRNAAESVADRVGDTGVVQTVGEARISRDGDAALLPVVMDESVGDPEDTVEEVVAAVEASNAPGTDVTMTGTYSSDRDFVTLSEEDLRTGEFQFGLPAALIVLLLVFGSVVAGLVPLLLAGVAIVVALALTALVGQAFELSFFVVNMLTGMGLALGIDYSLFILSRFREERTRGVEKLEAIAAAGATSSRAVLFSGGAVVLALLGMVLVPDLILRSLGLGAILVAAVAVLAALTLLPAVISLLGDRVDALRVPLVGRSAASEGRFWSRIVRGVMRRPAAALAVSVAFLLAAAVPYFGMERGFAGVSALPDRFVSKQGFDAYTEEFGGGGATEPAQIVVRGDADGAIADLRSLLARDEAFGPSSVEQGEGGVTLVSAPVRGDSSTDSAIAAVERVRDDYVPQAFAGVDAEVLVGGEAASNLDYLNMVDIWLPIVFAFVLALSFVLLTLAFRSIVVAAKAVLLNLLSVGAAYGLLVLVFQEGIGNELFGLEQADTIVAWVPLFLFSVLFGLSMDYHVFLLSRIRERYVQTGDTGAAVTHGVVSSARLITGAALIIVAVFAGFARGDLIMFQQMGFGVGVALLIDATLVRSVLVPAAMKLLGRHAWYFPSWLGWLPNVSVEGRRPAEPALEPSRS
jgi:RND superfamily putative drug exporter